MSIVELTTSDARTALSSDTDSDTLINERASRTTERFAGVVELRPRRKPSNKMRGPRALRRFLTGLVRSERGMATAEYAIATLAAVGFAGLLVVILRSEEVRGFLLNLVRSALSLP
ncbi:DUF4244 domain-containing protein [Arthrobacter sp. M4]|uniref:DUF4244 domain-containing protein n=1 Tax=Arthrobacter sp. M4 TaxID=218160 RepID=UPI001CDBBF50|nr:DUF4244 domain-containing protein [Arthrobacter sp. M4]MCA4135058.1 DUF4244 domain-containing protein [Arthrobacter sp. M4]